MARLFYCDYRVRLFVEIEVVVRRSFKQVIKNPNSFELRFDTWWSRRELNPRPSVRHSGLFTCLVSVN